MPSCRFQICIALAIEATFMPSTLLSFFDTTHSSFPLCCLFLHNAYDSSGTPWLRLCWLSLSLLCVPQGAERPTHASASARWIHRDIHNRRNREPPNASTPARERKGHCRPVWPAVCGTCNTHGMKLLNDLPRRPSQWASVCRDELIQNDKLVREALEIGSPGVESSTTPSHGGQDLRVCVPSDSGTKELEAHINCDHTATSILLQMPAARTIPLHNNVRVRHSQDTPAEASQQRRTYIHPPFQPSSH
jgi:hypothetical protein